MTSSKIEWQAYDRMTRKHAPDWYWAVAIIALSIMVTAILLDNILFAVLVVISTIALFLRTLQKPNLVRYELTSRGIRVDKEFRPFTLFESYWVTDNPSSPKLIMKPKGLITPLLIITLGIDEADSIREFLREYLLEEEQHEPFSKRIMEYLGF